MIAFRGTKPCAARLAALGRFVEPHVRRVLSRTEDEAARRSGREVLEQLSPR